MKKFFLLKLILFLILLIILDRTVGHVLQSLNNDRFTERMMNDFYSASENIDLLFLGSSHAYRSFNPYSFDGTLSLNAFNIGSPGQNPIISYHLLKEVLRQGHQPRLIVYEPFWLTLCGDDTDFYSSAHIFHQLTFSENKIEFFWRGFNFPSSLRLFSTIFYNRRFLRNVFFSDDNSYNCHYQGKGFVPSLKLVTADELTKNYLIGPNEEFNRNRISYLDKLLDLAKSENIAVIAVMAPVHPEVLPKIEGYMKIHKQLNDIFATADVPFIDYNLTNHADLNLLSEYFMDADHLNECGAMAFSEEMVRLLSSFMKSEPPQLYAAIRSKIRKVTLRHLKTQQHIYKSR